VPRRTAAAADWNRIEGTSGDDRIVGTSARDWVEAKGGNDYLRGLGGGDILEGGAARTSSTVAPGPTPCTAARVRTTSSAGTAATSCPQARVRTGSTEVPAPLEDSDFDEQDVFVGCERFRLSI